MTAGTKNRKTSYNTLNKEGNATLPTLKFKKTTIPYRRANQNSFRFKYWFETIINAAIETIYPINGMRKNGNVLDGSNAIQNIGTMYRNAAHFLRFSAIKENCTTYDYYCIKRPHDIPVCFTTAGFPAMRAFSSLNCLVTNVR